MKVTNNHSSTNSLSSSIQTPKMNLNF